MKKQKADRKRELDEAERQRAITMNQTLARSMRVEADILRACMLDMEAWAARYEERVVRLAGGTEEEVQAVAARARSVAAAAADSLEALLALLKPLSEAVPGKPEEWLDGKPSRASVDKARRMLKNPVRAVTRNVPGAIDLLREFERRQNPGQLPFSGVRIPRRWCAGERGNETVL